MFIGIDLGTSGVKAVLLDRDGAVRGSAVAPLVASRPQPRWSEQKPADWWDATRSALGALLTGARAEGIDAAQIEALGLTGQMHGATLLDAQGNVLRDAILWNDGRSDAECIELERAAPELHAIAGNLAMPGFTAPKLLWVRRHEPDVFARIAHVLLPKDYLRYRLIGGFATDPSDAAGTLWLDVAKRDYSDTLLAACGLSREQMPPVYEGNRVTGTLLPQVAREFGLREIPVVAGGGDNAAGAVGVGIVRPGQAMLSLGTSGVYFAVSDGFLANPASAVHSFCHALPDTWHLMSVMLNAAGCIDYTAQLTGYPDVAALLADAEANARDARPWFLPYLSGERTPHNNVNAKGVFYGLAPQTTRADLANATLEGVGFALLDGMDALHAAGLVPDDITVIGGGSRSAWWTQMLADLSGRSLTLRAGGEVGPALGAARLAHLALAPDAPLDAVCPQPPIVAVREPDAARHAWYRDARRPTFQALYRALEPVFATGA
ncbi:xylulokinase [Paraburkholderia caballeronis]|uniref:xylulokinase n=1 Tax=Paraburkholderia caballeronis TaxID=416943 RepID=UPI0010658F63|nr:xylulokinase [Paraburkholderia caballeronis]TDV16253.1 xylulokinase [Paraburkholderia caballeronis]TDV20603.1 xylulokinase [Paraburkholderia caballeronis]TDV33071.1 xylulokinase [Paraburkholderia caballeronis]